MNYFRYAELTRSYLQGMNRHANPKSVIFKAPWWNKLHKIWSSTYCDELYTIRTWCIMPVPDLGSPTWWDMRRSNRHGERVRSGYMHSSACWLHGRCTLQIAMLRKRSVHPTSSNVVWHKTKNAIKFPIEPEAILIYRLSGNPRWPALQQGNNISTFPHSFLCLLAYC